VRFAPAAFLLLVASPALADRDDFSIEYFTVVGNTARQLSAEIDAKGPIGDNGLRSDGFTRWSIEWHFDLESDADGCGVRRVTVDLDIRMLLPRWTPPPSTDPSLRASWSRYLSALRLHEDGHRFRAERAARDIRRAAQRARRMRDCAALTEQLNSTANALLAGLRAQQAAYDRDTGFGRKQGVRRP
jgi:predicted secreted Zn-dependent protease